MDWAILILQIVVITAILYMGYQVFQTNKTVTGLRNQYGI